MNRPLRALLAGVLLLPAMPAHSQQTTPDPEKRVDITLDGATAEEAVVGLSKWFGHPINVIFSGDSASTPLPSLRLHQVTLGEFFAAIEAAGRLEALNGRPQYAFAAVDAAPNIYTFSVVPPSTSSDPFASARATPQSLPLQPSAVSFSRVSVPAPPPPAKTSLFFDLSSIVNDDLTIEDLSTAIRTAWTAVDGVEPPADALKYHQETRLLIATGPPSSLEAVSNIVRILETRHRPDRDEQQVQLAKLNNDHRAALHQIERLTNQLETVEKERTAQIDQLRATIGELKIELAKRDLKN